MDVNKWFLSLPPERQAVLREDKWMLANAAAEAAAEAEREACAMVCTGLAPGYGGHMSPEEFETAMALKCAAAIRERSNAEIVRLDAAGGQSERMES